MLCPPPPSLDWPPSKPDKQLILGRNSLCHFSVLDPIFAKSCIFLFLDLYLEKVWSPSLSENVFFLLD